MEYKSGVIHESLTNEMAFELNFDFNFPMCIKRFNKTNLIDDCLTLLSLTKGSVIIVRWFKPSFDSQLYSYIEKVITNENEQTIKSESTVSKAFFEVNLDTSTYNKNRLFTDVTVSYNRNNKINQVIN